MKREREEKCTYSVWPANMQSFAPVKKDRERNNKSVNVATTIAEYRTFRVLLNHAHPPPQPQQREEVAPYLHADGCWSLLRHGGRRSSSLQYSWPWLRQHDHGGHGGHRQEQEDDRGDEKSVQAASTPAAAHLERLDVLLCRELSHRRTPLPASFPSLCSWLSQSSAPPERGGGWSSLMLCAAESKWRARAALRPRPRTRRFSGLSDCAPLLIGSSPSAAFTALWKNAEVMVSLSPPHARLRPTPPLRLFSLFGGQCARGKRPIFRNNRAHCCAN